MAEIQTPPADLEEVELQGRIKTKLPKDQAAAYREARTKDKSEREEMARTAGAAKAEKDAASAAAERAKQDKEAISLAAKGEVDQVRALLTKESNDKIEKLAGRYRDSHLRAAVANVPNLLKHPDAKAQTALVDDLVAQLRHGCRFDVESDTLVVNGPDGRPAVGHDGKPLQVDSWIAQHIEARPYLRQPTKTPGSGGAGGGSPTTGPSITQAAFDTMPPLERAKHFAAGGKIEG